MRQFTLLCLLLLLLGALETPVARAQNEYCDHPANLTLNCDMNTFGDHSSDGSVRVVADGWSVWVEAGNPAFDYGSDSPLPPSQRIWSDGAPYTGGMYQQVSNLTPGATYMAGVVWVPYTAPDGSIMRQIGLDPSGGSDPLAPSVQWGPEVWPFSRLTLLEQRAVATGTTMTLFIRVHNPTSHGADQIFIDGAWMREDPNAPAPLPASATPPSTSESRPNTPSATTMPEPTASMGGSESRSDLPTPTPAPTLIASRQGAALSLIGGVALLGLLFLWFALRAQRSPGE